MDGWMYGWMGGWIAYADEVIVVGNACTGRDNVTLWTFQRPTALLNQQLEFTSRFMPISPFSSEQFDRCFTTVTNLTN